MIRNKKEKYGQDNRKDVINRERRNKKKKQAKVLSKKQD